MRKLLHYAFPFSKQAKWQGYLFHSLKICLAVFLFLVSAKSFGQLAPVSTPTGGFRIDGNLKANNPVTNPKQGDWVDSTGGGAGYFVLNNDGSPVNAATTRLVKDTFNVTTDLMFSGGSKFDGNPNSNWTWTASKPTGKDDINNAMYHISTDAQNHKWIILGSDRLATTGTSYIDFEFLQGTLTRNPSGGGFTSAGTQGGRTVNDIVLSMEYTGGGSTAIVHFYKWQVVGSGFDWVEYKFAPTGPIPITAAFGMSNATSVGVPFGAFGSSSYIPFSFVEAAIDLTALFTAIDPCLGLNVKSVFIKTKASDALNAALKDFVDPIQVSFSFGTASIDYPGGPFCATGTATATQSGPTGGTYSASPAGLNFVSTSTGEINLGTSTPGTYTITYTFNSGGGCSQPTTTQVTIKPLPTGSASAATICSGQTTSVALNSTVAGSSFTWTAAIQTTPTGGTITGFSNCASSCGTSIAHTLINSGTTAGVVRYTVTPTADGCTGSTFSVDVTVNPKPTVTVNSPAKCAADPGISITATPGTGAGSDYNYAWTVPIGASDPGNVQTFSATVAGTYSVIIANKTTSCSSLSGSGTLTVNANPTITNPAVGAICAGTSSAALTYSGVPSGTDQYKIVWTSGPTTMVNFVSLPASPITIPSTGSLTAGTYNGTIYVKNSTTGCISAGDAVSLVVNANPTITSPAIGAICLGTSSASLSYSGVSSGVDQYRIVWTSGPATMNSFVSLPASPIAIPNTGSLTAGTYNGTIYVKNSTTGCISAGDAVSLLVNALPDAPTLSVTQPTCSNSNGTVTVTDPLDAGAIAYEYTKDDGAHWQDGVSFTIAADAGYSIKVRRKSTGCISAATSGTMGHATSTPAAAAIITQNVDCSHSTGKVKIVQASVGNPEYDNAIFEFSSDGVNFGSNPEFTFTAGQGYNLTVRRKTDHSCTASTSCAAEGGGITRTSSSTSEVTTESQTTVKAYPNPFSDRIKFVVTSPVAGKGNLEVYNMMGQRVKTVYQGFIAAGTQTFELSLSTQQIANLVYVLRIGDKKMSGKILQINQ